MKLRCDGLSPCSSCQKRNLPCNNDRRNQDNGFNGGTGPLPQSRLNAPGPVDDACEQSSDRGSIKFLLNAGTDSFTEQFRLPPRSDRARGLEYHNRMGLREVVSPGLPYNMENYQPNNFPEFFESDQVSMSFFHNAFVSFFNGPFGDPHKPLGDPYASDVPYPAVMPGQDPNGEVPGPTVVLEQDPNMTFSEQLPYEPERPFAVAMARSILTRALSFPLDTKSQQEVSTNVNFLLTTARIRKFVSMYFKYWHPSCPILHKPSFDPDSAPLPLLASVVFMGAMYSNDEMEVYVAKRILDFAELLIFSSDTFACENEICATFCGNRNPDDPTDDWAQFQNFQAGFLILLVQYWAGSRSSRSRAMENRFSEIIQVCFTVLGTGTANFSSSPVRWASPRAATCRRRICTSTCGFSKNPESGMTLASFPRWNLIEKDDKHHFHS